MQPLDQHRFLTAQEVAKLLKLPLASLYELVRSNRIAGIVRLGRRIRFDAEALNDWLASGGEPNE